MEFATISGSKLPFSKDESARGGVRGPAIAGDRAIRQRRARRRAFLPEATAAARRVAEERAAEQVRHTVG